MSVKKNWLSSPGQCDGRVVLRHCTCCQNLSIIFMFLLLFVVLTTQSLLEDLDRGTPTSQRVFSGPSTSEGLLRPHRAPGSSEKQQTSMSNGSSEKQKRKISTSTRRPPSSRGKGGAGGANISQGSSAGRQRKGVCVAKNFWYGPLDNRIDTGGHDDGLFVTLWTKPLKQCYD